MQNVNELNTELKHTLKGWSLLVKKYQQPDLKKAIVQIVDTFLPFIAIWVLMYFSLDWSYWITLLLAIVNAFFLVRIFIIQHDCGHQSFLGKATVNNIIGYVCSVFSSIPYNYWATNHNFHHVHSGQLEVRDIGDIDTLTVSEYKALSRWGRFKYRLFRAPLVLFVIAPIYYLLVLNRYPFVSVKNWKQTVRDVIKDNFFIIGLYLILSFLLGWKVFLMIQMPIIAFFGIIAFWFFYVQHQHEHGYKQWMDNWEYLLAAVKGSTFYKLPKLMHWLTGNIGYHHIHHLCSGIPNYNLVKCAEENPVFQKYVNTLTFWQSLRLITHKLWDEQQQRMITFSEFYRLERNGLLA